MSNDKIRHIRPLNSTERSFLEALGETPAEHQKQMAERLYKKVFGSGHSIKRDPTLRELNREVERRLTSTEPVENLVKKMLVPAFEWVPDAYVIFIRDWRCDCGGTGRCLDQGTLFLRSHKSKPVRDPQNSHYYLPVKTVEHGNLPRIREIRFSHQHICEFCFEKAQAPEKQPVLEVVGGAA